MTDAKEIAAGLTKAQREAIQRVRRPSLWTGSGIWNLRKALFSKGLIDSVWGNITPLGLQVRAELKRQEQSNG